MEEGEEDVAEEAVGEVERERSSVGARAFRAECEHMRGIPWEAAEVLRGSERVRDEESEQLREAEPADVLCERLEDAWRPSARGRGSVEGCRIVAWAFPGLIGRTVWILRPQALKHELTKNMQVPRRPQSVVFFSWRALVSGSL